MPEPEFREGTRRVFIAGALVAAVLAVVVTIWPLVTPHPVGTPPGGSNPATTQGQSSGSLQGTPAQQSAESAVGKRDPAGTEDQSGGRARALKQSAQALQLSLEQRDQLKQVVAQQQNAPRVQEPPFDLMIGTAVPRQVEVKDVPAEVTQIMNGYWGAQYVLVQDKLIIVDQHSRRVVAIVPGVA